MLEVLADLEDASVSDESDLRLETGARSACKHINHGQHTRRLSQLPVPFFVLEFLKSEERFSIILLSDLSRNFGLYLAFHTNLLAM